MLTSIKPCSFVVLVVRLLVMVLIFRGGHCGWELEKDPAIRSRSDAPWRHSGVAARDGRLKLAA